MGSSSPELSNDEDNSSDDTLSGNEPALSNDPNTNSYQEPNMRVYGDPGDLFGYWLIFSFIGC